MIFKVRTVWALGGSFFLALWPCIIPHNGVNTLLGYTLQVWHGILHWSEVEYELFLMEMRKALRNKAIHGYLKIRYVYGRKPEVG